MENLHGIPHGKYGKCWLGIQGELSRHLLKVDLMGFAAGVWVFSTGL